MGQWVRTSWTKRSRGGQAATQRNAAPIAFPLRNTSTPGTHTIWMREEHAFNPESHFTPEPPSNGNVLPTVDDGLRVHLVASACGMPRRRGPAPVVHLRHGQWLRWVIRLVDSRTGEWSYRLDTLNLAYGPVVADVFLGEPFHTVDERSSLR